MSGWKQWEWRVGRDLGGRRIPVTGIDRADRDVEAGMFWYQLKLRKSLPGWIFEWLSGICAACPDDKTGVLILRTPRMKDDDAIVCVRYRDWKLLHGSLASGRERVEPCSSRSTGADHAKT